MEVATEFRRHEVLTWLLRDATKFDRELLGLFALERKLADVLLLTYGNGFRPWWFRTREVSLKWRASLQLEFVSAPEGLSPEGGWWTAVSGVVSALPAVSWEAGEGHTQEVSAVSGGAGGTRSASRVEWTAAMSQAQLGKRALVKSIVFPAGITAIGWRALKGLEALESVVFPVGCTVFGAESLQGCKSLKAVSLPAGCKATGVHAFSGCSSLTSVTIPVGCMVISAGSFFECASLTGVEVPKSCIRVGDGAFIASGLKQVMIPDGCEVENWAFHRCRFLTTVTIGTGCTTIGRATFRDCTALARVTLPSTLKSIGTSAFRECPALATIAIPRQCQVDRHAFQGSKTRVTGL
jgi:hypothetical protein